MIRAVLLTLALVGPASAQVPQTAASLRPKLEAAAAASPDARFTLDAELPSDFRAALAGWGYPSEKFTNKVVLDLFLAFERQKPFTPMDSSAKDALEKAQEKAKPKEKSAPYGLRILGIELGAGPDPIQRENEPYLRKGPVDQVLDWDIRARVALDGLGARANYRHPGGLRSLSVGFLKYWDWPDTLGLDGARDKLYGLVGQTADKPSGGFELGVSGAVNEYVGGRTLYDGKTSRRGERDTDRKRFTLGTGISPLGDNGDEPWNVTLLLDGIWETGRIQQPGYDVDRTGMGYSLGVAFQLALRGIAGPWEPPPPTKDKPADKDAKEKKDDRPNFYFDRVQAKITAGQTPLSSFGVTTAAEVSFYVLKHLKLVPGLALTHKPSPDPVLPDEKPWSLGFTLGLDIKY